MLLKTQERFENQFPADYISEAVDQTRGRFYTLHAISALLFDKPSFKNVICLGHVVDANGQKMSKHLGNVIDPWSVINEHGADTLLLIRDTHVGMQSVSWYSELAARALAQIKAMEDVT